MKIGSLESGVRDSLANRTHCCFNEVCGQFVELSSGEGHLKVERSAIGIHADEGQVDGGSGDVRKLDLRFLGSLFQSLHSHLIAAKVNALALLELVGDPVDNSLVKIVAAEAVVTGSCKNFLNAVAHLDDGDIECAAAEVINHNLLVVLFINAVCKSRRCGLVDYSLDLKACYLTGILCSLTLGVGEVSGNGDNSLGDLLAEISLCIGLELLQDHCGNLLRGVLLVINLNFVVGTHLSLDGGDGSVGICDSLTLCDLADKSLAGLAECDDGRRSSCALGVGDNDGLAALDNRYT